MFSLFPDVKADIVVEAPGYCWNWSVQDAVWHYDDASLSENFDVAEGLQMILEKITQENYNDTLELLRMMFEALPETRQIFREYMSVRTMLFVKKNYLYRDLMDEFGIDIAEDDIIDVETATLDEDMFYIHEDQNLDLLDAIWVDDADKVKAICNSVPEFNFKQEFQLYDTYIGYLPFCAAMGAPNCYQYFVWSGLKKEDDDAFEAIKSGNPDMIHMFDTFIEEADIQTTFKLAETAIYFHRNDVFTWLVLNHQDFPWKIFPFEAAIKSHNYTAFKMVLLLHGGKVKASEVGDLPKNFHNSVVEQLMAELNYTLEF